MENITGMKVAILIEDGFEQVEMVEPRKALDQAGAETSVVSPRSKHVRAWNFTEWGDNFPVDVALDRARPDDFDALLLPGGVNVRVRPHGKGKQIKVYLPNGSGPRSTSFDPELLMAG